MTNRCESLRGLDLHAVSDEEVIEGSCFPRGSRFKACSITLTLPQTLFKALTKLNLRPMKEGGQLVEARTDCCEPNRQSTHDAGVLASVIRRVTLLRDFHARNSPVMIGQRFVRHYIRDSNAATRIQKYVRRWLIKRKTTHELAVILRDTGKLYLIQVRWCKDFKSRLRMR